MVRYVAKKFFLYAAIIVHIDIGDIFPDESHTWGSFHV